MSGLKCLFPLLQDDLDPRTFPEAFVLDEGGEGGDWDQDVLDDREREFEDDDALVDDPDHDVRARDEDDEDVDVEYGSDFLDDDDESDDDEEVDESDDDEEVDEDEEDDDWETEDADLDAADLTTKTTMKTTKPNSTTKTNSTTTKNGTTTKATKRKTKPPRTRASDHSHQRTGSLAASHQSTRRQTRLGRRRRLVSAG